MFLTIETNNLLGPKQYEPSLEDLGINIDEPNLVQKTLQLNEEIRVNVIDLPSGSGLNFLEKPNCDSDQEESDEETNSNLETDMDDEGSTKKQYFCSETHDLNSSTNFRNINYCISTVKIQSMEVAPFKNLPTNIQTQVLRT